MRSEIVSFAHGARILPKENVLTLCLTVAVLWICSSLIGLSPRPPILLAPTCSPVFIALDFTLEPAQQIPFYRYNHSHVSIYRRVCRL